MLARKRIAILVGLGIFAVAGAVLAQSDATQQKTLFDRLDDFGKTIFGGILPSDKDDTTKVPAPSTTPRRTVSTKSSYAGDSPDEGMNAPRAGSVLSGIGQRPPAQRILVRDSADVGPEDTAATARRSDGTPRVIRRPLADTSLMDDADATVIPPRQTAAGSSYKDISAASGDQSDLPGVSQPAPRPMHQRLAGFRQSAFGSEAEHEPRPRSPNFSRRDARCVGARRQGAERLRADDAAPGPAADGRPAYDAGGPRRAVIRCAVEHPSRDRRRHRGNQRAFGRNEFPERCALCPPRAGAERRNRRTADDCRRQRVDLRSEHRELGGGGRREPERVRVAARVDRSRRRPGQRRHRPDHRGPAGGRHPLESRPSRSESPAAVDDPADSAAESPLRPSGPLGVQADRLPSDDRSAGGQARPATRRTARSPLRKEGTLSPEIGEHGQRQRRERRDHAGPPGCGRERARLP